MWTVVAPFDARIVTGRDILRAERIGILAQRAELDEVVARDAWIGRAARGVLVDEAFDHAAAERLLEIQHVMRDSEHRGAAASVVEIVDSATAAGVRRARLRIH